jgi:hypothetical protein
MAFHSQYSTLVVVQQDAFVAEFLQQRLDLVVLKLDDPLLAFVGPANEGGKQNVVVLEDELHWKLDRGLKSRPDSETQCVKSSE